MSGPQDPPLHPWTSSVTGRDVRRAREVLRVERGAESITWRTDSSEECITRLGFSLLVRLRPGSPPDVAGTTSALCTNAERAGAL